MLSIVSSYTGSLEYISVKKIFFTSLIGVFISTPTILTLGVSISFTVISSKSKAERTKLLSCSSRTPCSSISSMMYFSSSSVTLGSSLCE